MAREEETRFRQQLLKISGVGYSKPRKAMRVYQSLDINRQGYAG